LQCTEGLEEAESRISPSAAVFSVETTLKTKRREMKEQDVWKGRERNERSRLSKRKAEKQKQKDVTHWMFRNTHKHTQQKKKRDKKRGQTSTPARAKERGKQQKQGRWLTIVDVVLFLPFVNVCVELK
jgi:cation transport ATPase